MMQYALKTLLFGAILKNFYPNVTNVVVMEINRLHNRNSTGPLDSIMIIFD